MTTTRVRDSLVGLLTDNARKPPRVLAALVADHLHALHLLADDRELVARKVITAPKDPPSWEHFKPSLVDDGIATTRARTDAAIQALHLEPAEVRAVVIEDNLIRVYRYTDRTTLAQTMPILEDQ